VHQAVSEVVEEDHQGASNLVQVDLGVVVEEEDTNAISTDHPVVVAVGVDLVEMIAITSECDIELGTSMGKSRSKYVIDDLSCSDRYATGMSITILSSKPFIRLRSCCHAWYRWVW